MVNKQINGESRTFLDIRNELVNFIRKNYPDSYQDFNDASVGMMLVELLAAVSENLHFNIDRNYQETQIEYAQERRSLMNIARTLGINVPNKSPSVTLLELTVTVPVKGDTFDPEYLPVILKGSQFIGAGNIFELRDDVNFQSPYSFGGIANRVIRPNFDGNGTLVSYDITKQEVALNGTSRIYKYVVTAQDSRQFFEIVLPDNDVLSIDNVITLDGINYNRKPLINEWLDPELQWYQVEALAQSSIFTDDINVRSENGVKAGIWTSINQRFIKEYTYNGFCKLIFGGGVVNNVVTNSQISNFINIDETLFPLGDTLKANSTLFIKYKVGGGNSSNVAANTITSLGIVDILVNGSNQTNNEIVRNSLNVNNPVPAFGGRDTLSTEELRHLIKYNFSSQGRAVTIRDYYTQILQMDGRYGVPARIGVVEQDNKVCVAILGTNPDGTLSNQTTNLLKQNIANYLEDKRMINDYVEIKNGKIINLSLDIDLLIDRNINQTDLLREIKNTLSTKFLNTQYQMGQHLYLSEISSILMNVGGIRNVTAIRVFNQIGNGYSLNESSQLLNDETNEFIVNDLTIYASWDEVLEIKNPNNDITFNLFN